MDSNRQYSYDIEPFSNDEHNGDEHDERISVSQLKHLVHLLDMSDVSEIEVKRAQEGMHLVMRKASGQPGENPVSYQAQPVSTEPMTTPVETRHTITSFLVGIYHPWSKPNGKQRISVGERVKVGQLVGTIQSLNVINEVETPFAGRVTEILVQDGQAVEYGQQLVVIDSSEEP